MGLEGIEPYMQSEQGLQEVVNADQHAKLRCVCQRMASHVLLCWMCQKHTSCRYVRDGVHGVPHFVISGPSGRSVCLSGAQAVQTLVKAFEEAVAAPMTD